MKPVAGEPGLGTAAMLLRTDALVGLGRAEEALAEDMSEENLRRLEAILDRIRRESIESGTG